MVRTEKTCSCDKHPENPDNICGNRYPFFGHLGWGEPYSRTSVCHACDGCFNRKGLEALSPEKRDVSVWVNSDDGPSNQFGKFSIVSDNCSYTIKHRLPTRFRQTLNQLMTGVHTSDNHYFAFDSEVGTHFIFNQNSLRIELYKNREVCDLQWGKYHPGELVMVIDPIMMGAEINEQQVDCPICGNHLRLMMHEGWIRHPGIGYDSSPRPFRLYYLSCTPDWHLHHPNNPVRVNEGERPFNNHPRFFIPPHTPWASFWSSKNVYPPK